MASFVPPAVGWHRDLPDFRDYTPRHPKVRELLRTLRSSRSSDWQHTPNVDLREYFPDVTNQQQLAASTAHACGAVIEYNERRAFGKIEALSRLYIYKSAQKLLRTSRDTGVDIRTTIKAIIRFGVPPEYHWPYEPARFDEDPDPFLQSFADEYRSVVYARLDQRNAPGAVALCAVRAFLAAGFPVIFGFPVPSSLTRNEDISYRPTLDSNRGGQVVVAVGYDDQRVRTSKGALLVRSSWGERWGEGGYGWLPYGYVEQQLAADFWIMLKPDWLESGELRRPNLKFLKRKRTSRPTDQAQQRPR